jgi:threonine synthase
LTTAACTRCRTPYPAAGLPELCPACGGFWGYPDGIPPKPPPDREPAAGAGLRRWAAALGLAASELPDRELGRDPHTLDGITLFQQGSAPGTASPWGGTFKERGAEVLAAVCARRGISEVFLDSSGNAGLALAAACAARGIACRVLVPSSTPEEKLRRLAAVGAEVEVVPGDRRAAAQAAGRLRGRLPYASHVYQPFFLAGVATLGWEIAAALPADALRRIVVPVGNGSLLLGVALGLEAAVAAGRLPHLPTFHAVQLAGYAALAPDGPGARADGPPVAAGIAVAEPPRQGEIARTIEASGGDVTVVTEEEIARAREELARRSYGTDPTGAAAWAGLAKRPDLRAPGTVVVLTSRER